MKRSSTLLLQAITLLIGISTFIFILTEPLFEGRNIDASLFEIYFNDPFLLCVYVASILFFLILFQIFKLLGYIRKEKLLSQDSLKALRTMRICGMSLVSFIVLGVLYLFIIRPGDDIAGGVFMGLLLIAILGTTTIVVDLSEALLRRSIDK